MKGREEGELALDSVVVAVAVAAAEVNEGRVIEGELYTV